MAAMRELSELEYVVLGVVRQEAPCTPYVIRQVFAHSPSSYWSGSAGAIYPLVRRLERRGLLESTERRRGSRTSRECRLVC